MKGFNHSLFNLKKIFSKEDWKKLNTDKQWLWWVGMIVLTTVILILPILGAGKNYKTGDIADETIYYEGNTLSYMSEVKYQQAKDAAANEVSPVYVLDGQKIIDAKGRVSTFVGELVKIKENAVDDHTTLYKNLLKSDYAESLSSVFEEVAVERLSALMTAFDSMLDELYAKGVKDADFDTFSQALQQAIEDGDYTDDEKTILSEFVYKAELSANNVYDKDATNAIIASKQSEVKPVEVTVRSGQIIVQRGTAITEEELEMMDKTGLLTTHKGFLYYPGILLLVLMLYYLVYVYCRRYFPYYAYDKDGVRLLTTFLTAFVLVCEAIMIIASNLTGVLYSVLGYFLPLSALAIIFTTLSGQRFSYFIVTVMSVFVIFLSFNQPTYAVVSLVSALFTVHLVGRIRERYQLVTFGFYIGIINAILIVSLGFIGGVGTKTLVVGVIVGFVSGFVSSLLALGVLPLAETLFKMTTPMKLLELVNPGHPLIKRLMTEAPGTYYHSVLVGNLAEAAAEAIGADSNLVRVASYFHDIGKLERPKYFVENQEPGQNPHEKLNPSLSTLIIVSHVKDGVEMAEAYDLPQSVVNIINEHHGNTVVRYFYHKAKAMSVNKEDVHIEDYCYPNPKPQSKESAILMMADSVQAALQSTGVKSKGDMKAKIHDIIQGQLAAGQFEECDLTFRDLHKVKEAFFTVLSGLSHYRIAYPTLMETEAKELERQLKAKKSGLENTPKETVTRIPKEEWKMADGGVDIAIDAPPIHDSSLAFPKITDITEDENED